MPWLSSLWGLFANHSANRSLYTVYCGHSLSMSLFLCYPFLLSVLVSFSTPPSPPSLPPILPPVSCVTSLLVGPSCVIEQLSFPTLFLSKWNEAGLPGYLQKMRQGGIVTARYSRGAQCRWNFQVRCVHGACFFNHLMPLVWICACSVFFFFEKLCGTNKWWPYLSAEKQKVELTSPADLKFSTRFIQAFTPMYRGNIWFKLN